MAPLRIALLIESSRMYGRELLRGIAGYSREHGPWLFFLKEWQAGNPLPEALKSWQPDGILVRLFGKRLNAQIRDLHLPTVDLYCEHEAQNVPYVGVDQKTIALEAIRHFQERGFRNFAFCGYTGIGFSERREAHFVQELKRQGIQPFVHRYPALKNPGKLSSYEEHALRYAPALAKWLGELPKPIALFACNDVRAYQVLNTCNIANIAVPEEVAVLGVDNDPIECEITNPPLSSIDPNAAKVGYEGAALLHRLIQGAEPLSTQIEITPNSVVPRRSTDVIAIQNADAAEAVRYVRRNALQPVDFAELLKTLTFWRSTLERWFHRYLGHSMLDEIMLTRIKHIQGLLLTTDQSLEIIADACGFKHVETMSRVFKKHAGSTPGEYRRKNRIL